MLPPSLCLHVALQMLCWKRKTRAGKWGSFGLTPSSHVKYGFIHLHQDTINVILAFSLLLSIFSPRPSDHLYDIYIYFWQGISYGPGLSSPEVSFDCVACIYISPFSGLILPEIPKADDFIILMCLIVGQRDLYSIMHLSFDIIQLSSKFLCQHFPDYTGCIIIFLYLN